MPQSVYLGGQGSVIVENNLALIASADDRIESSEECDPWLAGHGGILPNASSTNPYAGLTPFPLSLERLPNSASASSKMSDIKTRPLGHCKFRLAIAQLKLHPYALESLVRRQEPALELLADLDRSSAFPLLDALKKEKALEPEDLFCLGFHFSDGVPAERALGKDILELLAARYPRTKLGKSAKNKLKLVAV
jgi:hypothetical protein